MHHLYVVDDDPAVARLASLVLKTAGMEVESYTSPDEALSRLADSSVPNPAALVLDLHMPNLDGREFYKRAREVGYSSPVLILSAFGAQAAQKELGADAAVDKPFEPEKLTSTLWELLNKVSGPPATQA